MKTLLFLLLLCATALSLTAETAPLTLRSVIKLGDRTVFSVVSPESGRSAWVAVGDTFDGYRIVSFSAEDRVLVVVNDEQEHRIALAASSAARSRPEITLYTRAEELLAWIEGQPIRTQFERVTTYMALGWKAFVDGIEHAQNDAEILAVLRQHEQVLSVLERVMPSVIEAANRQSDQEAVQAIFMEVVEPYVHLNEPYERLRLGLLQDHPPGSEVRTAAERVSNRNRR